MSYAKRSAGLPLLLAFALAGCGGGCQRTEDSAPPGGGATGKESEKQQVVSTPVARNTTAPVASPKQIPTPPPELLSDCFVFVDAEPDYGDAPLTANFTTELECGNKPVTYSWDFGDGSSGGNETNPTHTYAKEGDYVAVVTVKTQDGEVGTDEIDIFVDEPAEK